MIIGDNIYEGPLKQCPFCGGNGVFFKDIRHPHAVLEPWQVYGVMCENDFCIMHQQQRFFSTRDEAERAWNRRTKEPQKDNEK